MSTPANEVEPHDPGGAVVLRELAAKRVERLAALELASLTRRFDPSSVAAFALFILPAAVGSYFAWTNSGWWTWPVLLVSAAWTVVVIAAGWSQFWTEYEEAEHESEAEG